jgi:hypothetical protein
MHNIFGIEVVAVAESETNVISTDDYSWWVNTDGSFAARIFDELSILDITQHLEP